MNVFEGIEHVSAEGMSNRQYFEAGHYLVKIDRVLIHERKLGGGRLFIVETTVNESNNQHIKPGERRNWIQSMSTPYALRTKTRQSRSSLEEMGACACIRSWNLGTEDRALATASASSRMVIQDRAKEETSGK